MMELQKRLAKARKEIGRRKGRWMWATRSGCKGATSWYMVLGWQFVTEARIEASKKYADKDGLHTTYREDKTERPYRPSKSDTVEIEKFEAFWKEASVIDLDAMIIR